MLDTLPFKTVYLDGKFVPAASATVSAFDRGFVFGDGVYEVMPVFGRRLFRLPHHLARLDQSLGAVGIGNPMSAKDWAAVFEQLIAGLPNHEDQSIYLQVTRGVAPRDHAFPKNATPTVFAWSAPLVYPAPEVLAAGVGAITADDIRWNRCDIKAITLLANVLLRQQAVQQGAMEAILIRDGRMTEGAASNIFVVTRGRLRTPPKGGLILPGITRDLVVELARAHGVPCDEADIPEKELRDADEILLTSSTKEIVPITRLDGRTVGSGRAGPMHQKMLALYQDYKRAFREGRAE